MDDSKNNTRLLIAAGLSFALMLVWWAIFPPKRPPAKPVVAAATTGTATAAVAAAQPGAQLAAGTSTRTTTTTVARPEIPRSLLTFEGTVPGAAEGRAVPYTYTLSNVGGVIESFTLPSFRERDASNQATEQPVHLAQAVSNTKHAMGLVTFSGDSTFQLPPEARFEVVEKTDRSVRYRYRTDSGVVIEREYAQTSAATFEIEMAVTVRNESSAPTRHRLAIQSTAELAGAMESSGFFLMPPPDHLNALCYTEGKVKRFTQPSILETPESFRTAVKWVAMDRQYFVSAIAHRDQLSAECTLSGVGKQAYATLLVEPVDLKPGQEFRHKFTGYFGVKQPTLLTRADAQLEAAVDYTILGLNLALLCQGLLAILAFIHGFTCSWGMAILGLTVIVKAALFPLSQRAGKSAKAMAALKPEMDATKERFKDDPQRQQEEMMKLMRAHGANPASGCLPVLIQMPIWFALYRSLWVSVDLYQEPFLWMPDLTARDPLWILPVLLVVVMYLQQKMTPTTMDATQQKVMLYFMPLMFGAMMAALPAGLAFYILVNSLLTIAQQHFINRSIGPLTGSSSAQEAAA